MISKIITSSNSTGLLKYLIDEQPHSQDYTQGRNYSLTGVNLDPLYVKPDGTQVWDSNYAALQFRAALSRTRHPKKIKAIHLIISASGDKKGHGDFPLPDKKDTQLLSKQAEQMRQLAVGYAKQRFPKDTIMLVGIQRDGAGLRDPVTGKHVAQTGHHLHAHIVACSAESTGKVISQNYTSVYPRTPHVYDKRLHKFIPGSKTYPGIMDSLNSYMNENFPKVTGREYTPIVGNDDVLVGNGTVYGYSWKKDMREHIYLAYQNSKTMADFIKNCPNEGVNIYEGIRSIGTNPDGTKKTRKYFKFGFYGQDKDKNGRFKYHEAEDYNILKNGKKRGLGRAFTPQAIDHYLELRQEQERTLENERTRTIYQDKSESIKQNEEQLNDLEPELVPAIHYFKQATNDLNKSAEDDDRQRSRQQREAENAEQQRQQSVIINRLNEQNNKRNERENKRAKQREKYLKLIRKLKQLEQFKYTKPRLGSLESAFRANPKLAQQLTNISRIQQFLGLQQASSNVSRNIEPASRQQNSVKQKAKEQQQTAPNQEQEEQTPHVNVVNEQKHEVQTNVLNKQNEQTNIPQRDAQQSVNKPKAAKVKVVGRNIADVVNKLIKQHMNALAKQENVNKLQAENNLRFAKRDFTRPNALIFTSGKQNLTEIQFMNDIKSYAFHDPYLKKQYDLDSPAFDVQNKDELSTDNNEDKLIDNVIEPMETAAKQIIIKSNGRVNGFQMQLNKFTGKTADTMGVCNTKQEIRSLVNQAYPEHILDRKQTINQAIDVLAHNVGQDKLYKDIDELKQKIQQDIEFKQQQEAREGQKRANKEQANKQSLNQQIHKQMENAKDKNQDLDNGQDIDDDK